MILACHSFAPSSLRMTRLKTQALAECSVFLLVSTCMDFFLKTFQQRFKSITYATMEGKLTWFRCRKCGFAIKDMYFGQWQTKYPTCESCGIENSRMDTLAEPVRLQSEDRRIPFYDHAYGSTRHGPGMEESPEILEQCQHPLGPWSMGKHGPQFALFRCRTCDYEKKATYKGQWKTTFPVCAGACGAVDGKMDCLDWWGETFTRLLPFRSSRYGPGTEILDSTEYQQYRILCGDFVSSRTPIGTKCVEHVV